MVIASLDYSATNPNTLMSSASVAANPSTGAAYSPRLQGAGVANVKKNKPKAKKDTNTYNLFSYKELNIAEEIKNLPLYEMTPIEVMNFVAKLQNELKEG